MPNWQVNEEVVEISKMQMYQDIVKVLSIFHFRFLFMQIESTFVVLKQKWKFMFQSGLHT